MYATCWGFIIGFYCYGVEFLIVIAFIMVGWLLHRFLPVTVAYWSMISVCYSLLMVRSLYGFFMENNGDLNAKTSMMMSYIKIHMVAQNMRDAAVRNKGGENNLSKRELYMSDPFLKGRLSLFEWLPYFFFCATTAWGPPIEYREFDDFINLRRNYGKMPPGKQLLPGFVRMGQALLCVAFSVSLGLVVSMHELTKPEFGELPFWYRVGYLILCASKAQTTLFCGFMFMETFMIVSGLSYSVDENGTEEFNTFKQVRVLKINFNTKVMDTTQNWNIQVHHWLKNYLLSRMRDRSLPRGAF